MVNNAIFTATSSETPIELHYDMTETSRVSHLEPEAGPDPGQDVEEVSVMSVVSMV